MTNNNNFIISTIQISIDKFEYEALRTFMSVYSNAHKVYIYNKLISEKDKAIFEEVCL